MRRRAPRTNDEIVAGARECGLAQSQVSRMIADREAGLGVRLLSRTTRAVHPTEAGLEFLARLIGTMERLFVAAPDYLARHGTPTHPDDLGAHRIVSGPVAPTSFPPSRPTTPPAPSLPRADAA